MVTARAFVCIATSSTLFSLGAFASSSAHAVTANFNFSDDPEVNFSSKAFTSDIGGLTATVSSPITSTYVPANGGLNASLRGLCAWARVGTVGGRCGYNVNDGASAGDGLSGFKVAFSNIQSPTLKSFDISQFAPPSLIGAALTFTSGSTSQVFNITGANTTYSFLDPFVVAPNNEVIVTSSGFSTTPNGGVFRLQSLTIEDVPGPLPLLGLGAAFGFSRKLKRKMNSAGL